jgi:hypothetical protein
VPCRDVTFIRDLSDDAAYSSEHDRMINEKSIGKDVEGSSGRIIRSAMTGSAWTN